MLLPSPGMLLKVSSNCSVWFKISGNNKKKGRKAGESHVRVLTLNLPHGVTKVQQGHEKCRFKVTIHFLNHTDEYSCYLPSKLLSWLHRMSRESNVVLVWWLSVLILHSMIVFNSFGSNYSGQDLAACNDIHFKWNEGRNSMVFYFRKKKNQDNIVFVLCFPHQESEFYCSYVII